MSATLPEQPPHQPAVSAPLPQLQTALPAAAVLSTLEALARKGKLAGFTPGADAASFSVEAFSTPFDHRLDASLKPRDGGTRIEFSTVMLRKAPAIFLFTSLLTIWPGEWLTDSMLRMYFPSYDMRTWLWYLPLTVLPLPWVWFRSVAKSRSMSLASATEAVATISSAISAHPVN